MADQLNRDCSTCVNHVQTRGVEAIPKTCYDCISFRVGGTMTLPYWVPRIEEIEVADIKDRHMYPLLELDPVNQQPRRITGGKAAPAPQDDVNHPAHYLKGGIETIDFIKAKLTPEEYRGYLKGNILKYVSRANEKGTHHKDIAKAGWYAQRLNKEIA